jgi:restriction endonuclease Mrr
VDEEVVREFWDEVRAREVNGGILITTGIFSRQARDWADGKRLSLMEGEEFLDAWRQGRAD